MKKKTARLKRPKRSNDLRKRAERLLQESPPRPEVLPEKDLKSLVHELQVYQVELEMQNEELRRAQVELEASRNRYFELYDLAPVGYFTLERNGLVLEANLTGALILGTERGNLEKRPFLRFVHPDDQSIFFSHLRKLLETRTAQICELRLVTRNDTTIYGHMESTPVRNGIDEVIGIRTALLNFTRQKQAELALTESEEKFRLIAETSTDIIFQTDPKGIILYCSPSITRTLGYTLAEIKGNSLDKYLTPSDVPVARQNLQRLLFGEKVAAFEVNILTKSGKPVPFEVSMSTSLGLGKVKFIFGIARDITDRKRAEDELQRREEHLRLAVEGGNLGTWERDLVTEKTTWNEILYKLVGRDSSQPVTGETFFEYIHKDDLSHVREHLEEAYRNETRFVDEFRIIREDGQVRWITALGCIYRDHTGQPVQMAGVNLDTTDRRDMEDALREYQNELEMRVMERTAELSQANKELRAEVARRERYEEALRGATEKILLESRRRRFLSGRLVETLEGDRREVAMYLHDQIGQMLATLKMDLEMTRKGPARGNGLLDEKLRGAEDKVGSLMSFVKDISRKLRPNLLDTLGLIPALRSLVESFRTESGLRIHLYYRQPPQEIEAGKSLAIYRITQEALNNVAKHAHATNVFVNLILKDDAFQLSVEDDGIGFNYEDLRKDDRGANPLGIMIMKERAALVGGEVFVESEVGKGTHVVVEIPLDYAVISHQ